MSQLTSCPIKTVYSGSYPECKLPIAQKLRDKQFTVITHVEKLSAAERTTLICLALLATIFSFGITCAFKWQITQWQEGVHGKRFPRIQLLNKILDVHTFLTLKTQSNNALINVDKVIVSIENDPKKKTPAQIALIDKELIRVKTQLDEMRALNPSAIDLKTLESNYEKLCSRFAKLDSQSYIALKSSAEQTLNTAEKTLSLLEKDLIFKTNDEIQYVKDELKSARSKLDQIKKLNPSSPDLPILENRYQNLTSRINLISKANTPPAGSLLTRDKLVKHINSCDCRMDLKKIYLPPKPLYTQTEATAALKYDCHTQIGLLWNTVATEILIECTDDDDLAGKRRQLMSYVGDIFFHTTKPNYLEKRILLSLIVQKLRSSEDRQLIKQTLLEIVPFYEGLCEGGQIPTLHQRYRILKGETSLKDYLVNAMSTIKETLIENFLVGVGIRMGKAKGYKEAGVNQLHKNALNYVKRELGDAFGLDKTSASMDDKINQDVAKVSPQDLQDLVDTLNKQLQDPQLVIDQLCLVKERETLDILEPHFRSVVESKFGWDTGDKQDDEYIYHLLTENCITTDQRITPFGAKLLLMGGDFAFVKSK